MRCKKFLFISVSKLKRDSAPYESDITDTDRLLIQKDEEVIRASMPIEEGSKSFYFQIRRMQEMLKQMQEKLKVDAQDSNKKHESIIDV